VSDVVLEEGLENMLADKLWPCPEGLVVINREAGYEVWLSGLGIATGCGPEGDSYAIMNGVISG